MSDSEAGGDGPANVEYVTQVHIHTTRFEYPPDWNRNDHFEKTLDERAEADIGTGIVFRGHRQIRGESLEKALPELDLSECETERDTDQ